MGYKLSIVQRQFNMTGWHQSKQFDVPSVQKIKADGAGKGRSLNAIPSPFARMHLFETAFEMVFQDLINSTKLAGEAYNRIVSDCLDVFEFIYNWDSHINDGKSLEIVIWNREKEIYDLENSINSRHKLLGQTLDVFLQGESAFRDFEKCLIIKYNGKVIAGTSPFTGFITTPDDLTKIGLLKPLSQIAYFSRTIPFEERRLDIKKYVYDFFENNSILKADKHASAIRDFLEWHQNNSNIPSHTQTILKSIVLGGINFEIFGQNLKTSRSVGTEYFEKQIVRLNYRVNDACFIIPRSTNSERTYDYLLPLTASFLEQYPVNQIEKLVSIIERDKGSVEVSLTIDNRSISKIYQEKPIHETDGKIVDLFNDFNINFNVGIFPFLKVIGQTDEIDFNDFYRIMITFEDLNYRYSNKEINLKFGKNGQNGQNGQMIENGSVYKISRIDRTVLERDKTVVGSTFYALDTSFDFIQVEFPVLINGSPIHCIIAPKWEEKLIGQRKMDFAIDLGTTSTFIAYVDEANHEPQPLEFDELKHPVVLLNKPKGKKDSYSWIESFETTSNDLLTSIKIQKEEFIPSIIKRNEKYEFPIRTVLYQQRSIAANKKKTLQNANISFVYQKKDVTNLELINQEFKTNLKWNIKTDIDFENAIEVFIEEVFLLIRTKILLNEGDPRKSKICWFSPISFTAASKRAYTDLWNKYSKKILKHSGNNISSLTESEAPYYYLFKNHTIYNPKSVLTLDIGGGSTDIMLFEENKPVFGTSVHFGANVIWGNGFSSFISEKTNGIYLKLKDQIRENLNGTLLKKANEDYCSVDSTFAGSEEIMNFWIANKDLTDITNKLKNGDFRLSYLLHLSALIYHNLRLIKVRNKIPPTCIIFSGNGSRYIDFIHDANCIERIWGYFARKIFGENVSNPQVILPAENRKEATCYGGLFKPSMNLPFEVENYLGFEGPGEKYSKYRDIETNANFIFKRTLEAFNEFVSWFFEMNDTNELNFRNEFGIEVKLAPLKKFIIEKAEENLNTGYYKRMDLVDRDDLISDSIFYYPLIGLIYRINKLSADEINNMIGRTVYYLNGPDGEREFLISKATMKLESGSLYTITVENDSMNTGVLNIIDNPTFQKRALAAYQGFIDPVCSYKEFPQANQLIKTINAGKVRKEGDKWVITEKINIEFV